MVPGRRTHCSVTLLSIDANVKGLQDLTKAIPDHKSTEYRGEYARGILPSRAQETWVRLEREGTDEWQPATSPPEELAPNAKASNKRHLALSLARDSMKTDIYCYGCHPFLFGSHVTPVVSRHVISWSGCAHVHGPPTSCISSPLAFLDSLALFVLPQRSYSM